MGRDYVELIEGPKKASYPGAERVLLKLWLNLPYSRNCLDNIRKPE
jgi:hypothetical protein